MLTQCNTVVIRLAIALCLHAIVRAFEGYIIGGSYAEITDYPHSAYLEVFIDANKFICGSSIISQQVLLTAAHCFELEGRVSGHAFMGSNVPQRASQVRSIAGHRMHERYDNHSIANDICLVYLNRPVLFCDTVKKAIIPERDPKSKDGYVAGWGVTYYRMLRTRDQKLKQVYQKINRAPADCYKAVGRMALGTICAGVVKGADQVALGDSGSALVTEKDRSIQVGIVSYSFEGITMTVYTNVVYFRPWILTNILRLTCGKS